MAVRSTAVSGAAHAPPRIAGPVRTCIGCRTKAAATELLRVVVAKTFSGAAHPVGGAVLVVPDPPRSAPGRGAWLHPTAECAELAQRRRAYVRALRVPGAIDSTPVLELLAPTASGESQLVGTRPPSRERAQSNGHSMKFVK